VRRDGVVQSSLAVRPTARTVRWALLALTAAMGSLMVWSGARKGGDPLDFHLPAAGLFLAVWLGFQLADNAAVTVASSPMTLLGRRLLRLVVAVPPIVLVWALLCVQADAGAKTATLSALFLACICVALGLAGLGERLLGPGRGGPLAIAGLFVVFAVLPATFRVTWSLEPTVDSWHHLFGRWLWIAGFGVLSFLLASVDPARRFRGSFGASSLASVDRAVS